MNRLNHESSEFSSLTYRSQGSIDIGRRVDIIPVPGACDYILDSIDSCRGALFSSSYEYPGRYTQWDIGFVNPCLELRSRGLDFSVTALSGRGLALLPIINSKLSEIPEIEKLDFGSDIVLGRVRQTDCFFVEEMRSRQPTVFTVIRAIQALFASPEDRFLGLYGAFGYDLVFQFEPMDLLLAREADQADLVLYLPDELVVVNHRMERAYHVCYSFPGLLEAVDISRSGIPAGVLEPAGDQRIPQHEYGRYAGIARHALEYFARGDLFEVVPSQTIYEPCAAPPSQVFKSLKKINPSPYGFIINLGNEHLVGASPEMYVRVEGRRVETCPISGTIKRGRDAIEDSVRIRELLNSFKDEAELTMCTDVDRNDKSRVCQPGSVKVIGRRQIEMYSHLIHTVDHVEGLLRPEFDALDAFLTHMWAVTVTGAPKRAAIKWLEQNEDSARGWYGGAVGFLSFNGDLNTGLTLRTIRIKNGIAQVRVGATLLYDSIPESEEAETYLKAAAMMKALRVSAEEPKPVKLEERGKGKKILLVDHEDSFVHTLANYFRQTGAEIQVLRAPLARRVLQDKEVFDLVILSPGPGRPDEFALNRTIELCLDRCIPIFGVCLGLQGLVEYFGGSLGQLAYPQHGKTSKVRICGDGPIWQNLPEEFSVGRYHSLYASSLPACLTASAISEDGVVMAIEHIDMPVAAVQFHPESIMTADDNNGLRLISNVVDYLS